MPIFRSVFMPICLIFQTTLFAEIVLGDWFQSPMVQLPHRLDDLGGDRIIELTKTKTSTPLMFPKAVSIFERMDSSLHKFYTLDQLASNPGLQPFYRFHSNFAVESTNPVAENSRSLKVSERERQLFDTSLLLVPQGAISLPSDDQLQAFLEEGRQRYTPPVNPKEIIDNLLKDEYADHPVVSLLNESPEVKKVLKSESFNQSTNGLFNSANLALKQPLHRPDPSNYKSVRSQPAIYSSSNDYNEVSKPNGPTVLKLKARKPSRDGTLRPAQASEIYLTTQDLKVLLKDLTKDPAIAGEVRSVAELWAKAEKNGSQNPEIALGVKSILLSAKVGRARTDPYGQASMENLSPDDKYYVIGIDKDVETDVVTIWSKEVEVSPGENLVELSSTDIIYQE